MTKVPAHSHSKWRPRGTRKLSEEGRKACLPSSDKGNALTNESRKGSKDKGTSQGETNNKDRS